MTGVVHIDIQESVEELEGLVRQQKNARLKERIQALYLIKGQEMSVSAIAKILGKHRGTVHRWLADYREGGIEAVVEFGTSSGRKRAIPHWAVSSLKKQLEEPEGGFQRYTQIQHWLDITLGVQAEYATVHHLARYRLKAKLKVPRPRNRKQDKEKLEAFKKTLPTICN
ncbi:helix-turn-helix domain-containing protein [Nostoc sp. DedQUE09]|uniref:helix-turn-helix domain-containing protein n=1 Tax=Nostoc sp. DedQUE09 TaxID=3075394 RepID=UPI002AD27F08|nr:helix-turn-helix domain-containing protein [Nostoc sp. DedQUE09]MDZ7955758.1 helix-turn-helix domain-containing protein [Nostoc sp. DedQUE09]